MASQTNLKAWLPGVALGLEKAVAIDTFNPSFFVQFVVKSDWLPAAAASSHSHDGPTYQHKADDTSQNEHPFPVHSPSPPGHIAQVMIS
jgi:hypothetical protein